MTKGRTPDLCVIFPGALGDFVCFLPALRSLTERAPVDLFARGEFADLAPPGVKVYSSECHQIAGLFLPGAPLDDRLRRFFQRYDCIFSWLGSQQQTFVQSLQVISQHRARVFPFRPADGANVHQADYYVSCIGENPQGPAIPTVVAKPDTKAWSESYWAQHGLKDNPVLSIGPGSGSREKNWPVEFYSVVAKWWTSQVQGQVLVLVGPVEEERQGLDGLRDEAMVASHLSLGELAALLQRSTAYLGNDSGVTHLAAALGVPTIALFGPSDLRQWAPRGEQVTILSRNVECSPCHLSVMKSCLHRKCLAGLAPKKVMVELEKLLQMANLTRVGPGITV